MTQTLKSPSSTRRLLIAISRWFDNESTEPLNDEHNRQIDWPRSVPFILMHVAAVAVFWVGTSPVAVLIAIGLYALRMFAITGFYHRYFSHKAFRTSRLVQFFFAMVGASAVQRGPIWWSSHHRHHHVHADEIDDAHSPVQHGFFWSHVGWFLCRINFNARSELVKDWLRYPELRFLDRFDTVVPALLAVSLYGLGVWLSIGRPDLGTNGPQMLVWGFVISTLALYHATFTVNSLAHVWGQRRYSTRDASRNNAVLAFFTLGEGWHNNHHHYPAAARQGFFWWEVDPTYYLLKLMETLGLVWELKALPEGLRERRRTSIENSEDHSTIEP
jgi:stearoyl-CoA desaturase (delta-9 desaturase)